ncbi:MAG: N-acetyl-gamma-glutamyl-phosphate reductase [Bacteroidota bacterium]|jgi:N-acetyl-gamma-glutamyl-phosphate reductase|nr:N-acetyl-gamma-glutamyl-phosphate reductase [Bacteroidota bacterium]HHU97819.1 N-acetyl-gamma-glutamyl-phosphate reductase [Petrimonas sp.]
MIKVSIVGGTGYTAGELLRILLRHPNVHIESVISSTSAGTPVAEMHRDLMGETDLVFTDRFHQPDVIFLCLGHGLSRSFLQENDLPATCRVIDLGNDFRNEPVFGDREFVFGLCELNREQIRSCHNVANPGCFATSILLGLLPLAAHSLLRDEVHVHAITGSTGAGKRPGETTHFSYRDGNISVYKAFTHQHLEEIRRTLASAASIGPATKKVNPENVLNAGNSGNQASIDLPVINFVPMRGDFTRGIFASLYTRWNGTMSETEAIQLFKSYYEPSPFVFVSDQPISLKEVVNTNKALLHVGFHNGYIHITSIIDNLLKGASGQAVQNMNLMFGLDEATGLQLKGSAF